MSLSEKNIKESYTKALKKIKESDHDQNKSAKKLMSEVTNKNSDIQLQVVLENSNECCSPSSNELSQSIIDLEQNRDQNISFGCVRLNEYLQNHVKLGNTIIDFGSGPGHDLFMAARIVGKEGKAIGIDFTDVMIDEAKSVANQAGLTQVELVKASIDDVPLPNNTADFIISNCVINLAFNKQKVFDEAFRLLKPGGMLIDADVISDKPLGNDIQSNDELWCSCVGGALTSDEYTKKLAHSGFVNVNVELGDKNNITFDAKQFGIYSGVIMAQKPSI